MCNNCTHAPVCGKCKATSSVHIAMEDARIPLNRSV